MRRVGLGRALWIAALCALIPLAGNVIASFLTDWVGVGTWLSVPVVAVAVAVMTELVQAYGKGDAASEAPPGSDPRPPPEAGRPPSYGQRRGTPLPVAVLIALVVLGAGGVAVTQGVRYAVGYVTGNESGSERLVRPEGATERGLTLTVESVQHTSHFTRVRVTAFNETGISLTLPLFGNCTLVGDGTALEADGFKSRWTDQLAPGARQTGTITFDGHLPDRARRASLNFATVFGQGFDGPSSIQVREIQLGPP